MMNLGTSQRALRTDASTSSPAALRVPHWRRVPSTPSIAPKQPHGARGVVVCNVQQYGRGQPPNQPQQQPMALTRRPLYQPVQPQQPVYLNLSQVTDKQVITRNAGNKLGTMGEAWVDPARLEVVSFELEAKRGVGSTVIGNIPLATLKQIGDVVLVQDERAAEQQPLDSRYGYVKLLGMEVRTRGGRVLGKVRDIAFNPDNGAISRVEYDDFGLRFLPVNFFDTYSVPADFVLSAAYGYVEVSGEEYGRQEKLGILSGILRGVGSRQQVAGLLTDGSRASEVAGYLPTNYTYEQWEGDIRRWEAETGMRYEEYVMQQQAQTQQRTALGPAAYGGARGALPPGRPQQQPMQQQAAGPSGVPQQQQAQPRYAMPPAGAAAAGGRPARPGVMTPQQQQPMQQQQAGYGSQGPAYGGYGGGAGDPRYRGPGSGPAPAGGPGRYPAGPPPQQQQQQQQQPPQQQWAGQQQQQVPAGWPAPGAQQSVPPPQQRPQQQQVPPGPRGGPGAPPPAQQAQQPPQQPQAAVGGQNGGGGALRVDEWLTREGQAVAEPALEVAGRRQPMLQQQMPQGVEANGWDSQGAAGSRPPY